MKPSSSTPEHRYWLIAYAVRRSGHAEWTPANMAWYGTPGGALRDLMSLDEEYKCEHVVTAAMQITKADYKWLKENV